MYILVGECSAFLASGSDPTNVRHKNNGVEQKADVVLLMIIALQVFAAYLCLYRRLHGPEYPQLRVRSRSCWRGVNNAHARSVGSSAMFHHTTLTVYQA